MLIVVCLVALVTLVLTRTDGDDSLADRARTGVVGDDPAELLRAENDAAQLAAQQFVLRFNTYGPADLDEQNQLPGYLDRVGSVLTAKFLEDFETNGLPLASATVSQAGYARTAEVYGTGVTALDADSATVLVFGTYTSSYPDGDAETRIDFEPTPLRWSVNLLKIDGAWLVDNWVAVTGTEEDEEAPVPDGALPTAPPTGQPTGQPTTGEGR